MSKEEFKCPNCGHLIVDERGEDIKSSKYIIKGALVGFLVGAVFDNFYFYIGVITDFFSFMPIVHLIAGTLLGSLVGWVIGERKKILYARGMK